jgi:hypothetical protein
MLFNFFFFFFFFFWFNLPLMENTVKLNLHNHIGLEFDLEMMVQDCDHFSITIWAINELNIVYECEDTCLLV